MFAPKKVDIGSDLDALVARQITGMTLEQMFYTNDALFARDIERIVSKQWLLVDHASKVPNVGDYLTFEIAGESVVIVRGEDGQLRAFFNVCRHRGSRICLESAGNLKALVCPYHAWRYGLNGELLHARSMPSHFRASDFSLHACALRVWHGLIFICLSQEDDPQVITLDTMTANLDPFIRPYGLDRAKAATIKIYPTHANWKLVVENFRECYHCAPAHPQYTAVNEYVRMTEKDLRDYEPVEDAWAEKWKDKGHATGRLNILTTDRRQPHSARTRPVRDGWSTLSDGGKPVAPLMGELKEYDGGNTLVVFGPLNYMYLANDHATLFRFTPTVTDHTEVVVTWLVRDDAREGKDYDLPSLTWLWDQTTIQDTRIINNNQLGVNSRRYSPGPYAPREANAAAFTQWYLSRIA